MASSRRLVIGLSLDQVNSRTGRLTIGRRLTTPHIKYGKPAFTVSDSNRSPCPETKAPIGRRHSALSRSHRRTALVFELRTACQPVGGTIYQPLWLCRSHRGHNGQRDART